MSDFPQRISFADARAIVAAVAGARRLVVENVPLARALYGSCQVGQEIPAELFAAVAQVLAFVIGRRTQGQRGGSHDSPRLAADVPAVPKSRRRKR